MPQSFRRRGASDRASDIGFYVYFGPSSETPWNPGSATKEILLQSDIAVTGVLTHFSQQAAADSSCCSRKVKLVDLTLRQGAGNRRRSVREAEAVQDLPYRIGWMGVSQNPHAVAASGALEDVNNLDRIQGLFFLSTPRQRKTPLERLASASFAGILPFPLPITNNGKGFRNDLLHGFDKAATTTRANHGNHQEFRYQRSIYRVTIGSILDVSRRISDPCGWSETMN
jgi:hypothetical protein